MTLKEDFKKSSIYENGLIYLNSRRKRDDAEFPSFLDYFSTKNFKSKIISGRSRLSLAFDQSDVDASISFKKMDLNLSDVGRHVLREAINQKDKESQLYKKNEEIKDYGTLRKKFISYIHFNIHNDSKDENIIQNANQVRTWEHRKFEIMKKIKDGGEREKFKKAVERRVLAKFDEVIFLIRKIAFFFLE